MITIGANIRGVKRFVALNKRLYFINLVVFIIGLVIGIVLVAGGQMDETIYTSINVSITDIIVNDYSVFSLFFAGLIRLIVPIIIIFIMFLTRYTSFLGHLYYGYQALLLGASIAGLVGEGGVAGVLNSLFVVIPINIINFFLIASSLVVFYKRLKLATTQKITLVHSLKIMLPKLIMILVGVLFSAVIYGFIYPILLRSMIIVNV